MALAVNSATSGLHLALEAAEIKAGDEVIVPSYTFWSDIKIILATRDSCKTRFFLLLVILSVAKNLDKQ